MRTGSKCSPWLALLLILFVFTDRVHGQNKAVDIKSPVCKVISLPYLMGEIALSFGSQNEVARIMPCLLKLWEEQLPKNKDKANIELSNSFLFVMSENPSTFFSMMTTEPKVFSNWLNELPDLSFSPPDSPLCQPETKRKELIETLQKTHIDGQNERALVKLAVTRLSEISCLQAR
jgi:hypothetical protein